MCVCVCHCPSTTQGTLFCWLRLRLRPHVPWKRRPETPSVILSWTGKITMQISMRYHCYTMGKVKVKVRVCVCVCVCVWCVCVYVAQHMAPASDGRIALSPTQEFVASPRNGSLLPVSPALTGGLCTLSLWRMCLSPTQWYVRIAIGHSRALEIVLATNVWLSGPSRLLSSEGLAPVETVGVGFEARVV